MGVSLLALAGCEQLNEEYIFSNETPTPVRIGYGNIPLSDEKAFLVIAPGATQRYASRPVDLPENPIIGIDHEAQFRYKLRDGITLIDGNGARWHWDTAALRAQMELDDVRVFTMHIKPALLKSAP
jgi:hypothetical protein